MTSDEWTSGRRRRGAGAAARRGPAARPATWLAALAIAVGVGAAGARAQDQGLEGFDGQAPSYRGIALPERQVDLNAPVTGRIATVPVEEGQTVEAEAVLATMDSAVQEAVVAAAKLRAERASELNRAKLQLEEASVKLQSTKEAFEKGAAEDWEVRRSRVERDLAQVAVDAAKEETAIAEAQLALERERLERFTLRAPWPGYVSRVAAAPGATVSGESAIMRLIDLSTLRAEFYLPAALFDKIAEGRRYVLAAERPVGQRVEAECIVVTRMIDPASETFRCVMRIANPRVELPGGFAVRLIWPQPNGEAGSAKGAGPEE